MEAFSAVATTGIYCRPGCPARQPLAENVTKFALAAAAEGRRIPGVPALSTV
ncbi:MAG: Ada metal-binding domain-containing protein [Candidatus Limnocylindria bacterium]